MFLSVFKKRIKYFFNLKKIRNYNSKEITKF